MNNSFSLLYSKKNYCNFKDVITKTEFKKGLLALLLATMLVVGLVVFFYAVLCETSFFTEPLWYRTGLSLLNITFVMLCIIPLYSLFGRSLNRKGLSKIIIKLALFIALLGDFGFYFLMFTTDLPILNVPDFISLILFSLTYVGLFYALPISAVITLVLLVVCLVIK